MNNLDIDFVRKQFPAFQHEETQQWGFFENAGGSYVPKQVNDRLAQFFTEYKVQPYGSSYMQQKAGAAMDAGYETISQMINAERDEITLGPSTTMNLYVLMQSIRPLLQPGDEVIVTNQDHEANVGCWRRLEEFGVVLKEWQIDSQSGELNIDGLKDLLTDRTKVVCFSLCSNIVGTMNDVKTISALAHDQGVIVVADGVSFAPHHFPDTKTLGVDFLTFSTYKTFGTHLGVLWGNKNALARIRPQGHYFNEDSPNYRMNPTGPLHAEIGALAGLDQYISDVHAHHFGDSESSTLRAKTEQVFELFAHHENKLTDQILNHLTKNPKLRVIGQQKAVLNKRAGTIAISPNHTKDLKSIADKLALDKIAVGVSNFYAVRCLEALGIPADPGVIRISLVHYNNEEEVTRLLDSLDKAIS